MATANTIINMLAGLDAKEVQMVRSYLVYKNESDLVPQAARTADLTPAELMYWNALVEISRVMGLNIKEGGAINMIESYGRPKFMQDAQAIDTYVSHHAGIKLTTTHKQAIYVEVLSCLVRWMRTERARRAWEHPRPYGIDHITIATIGGELGGLPQAVQRAYPDYARARLLHVVVAKGEQRGRINGV